MSTQAPEGSASPPGAVRSFARSFNSIQQIFEFTADVFARLQLDRRLLPTVDFAVEELFTNMVKYSTMSHADVEIEVKRCADGVEVTLTDFDVEPFDVTRVPDADVKLPIEQRRPGGLGLHLVRHLVDSIEYEYRHERRASRITFRKTGKPAPFVAEHTSSGADNARD
jgi:anti-sigma regulatory factor (Ser/Thr protein kinase)